MGFARDVLPHLGKAGKWIYPITVRPIAKTKYAAPLAFSSMPLRPRSKCFQGGLQSPALM
jgi:hypothetical protein